MYGLLAAKQGCFVVMFDPQPGCMEWVDQAACMNQPYQYAPLHVPRPVLGGHDKTEGFGVSKATGCARGFGGSTQLAALVEKFGSDKTFAEGISGDQLMLQDDLLKEHLFISIIKLDTEGWEVDGLAGMFGLFRRKLIGRCFFEGDTALWKRRGLPRTQAWEVVENIMGFGYDLSLVSCIPKALDETKVLCNSSSS
jgi:hypothetical protein